MPRSHGRKESDDRDRRGEREETLLEREGAKVGVGNVGGVRVFQRAHTVILL